MLLLIEDIITPAQDALVRRSLIDHAFFTYDASYLPLRYEFLLVAALFHADINGDAAAAFSLTPFLGRYRH